MSDVSTGLPAAAAFRQRFVDTLNHVKPFQVAAIEVPAAHDQPDHIDVSFNERDDRRVYSSLLKDRIGGVPVSYNGPTVTPQPMVLAEMAKALATFPGVTHVSGHDEAEFPNEPGQKSTITITTCNRNSQFFLENVLRPQVQVDGVTALIKVQATN